MPIKQNKDKKFMCLAIEKAKQAILNGQTPFGACIVKNGKVLACEHNLVWKNTDITAHAEIVAIRVACQKLKTIDLSGCIIYSTCEPCQMCFAAIHWAKISKIVYGVSINQAKMAGFNELLLYNRQLKRLAGSKIQLKAGFMCKENSYLFTLWLPKKASKTY